MNDMRVSNPVPVNDNTPPLSALMDETTCMAADALGMVYSIGQHMFCMDEPKKDDMPDIKCFRDVLVRQAITLKQLNEALNVIMDNLGVWVNDQSTL